VPRKAITEAGVIRIKIERKGCKYPLQMSAKTKHRSGSRSGVVFFSEKPSSFFRIALEETQKAPSTMAPTKTNAAHTASTLSFIVTPTRRTSIVMRPIKILP
jgi:hypothetical protein